MSTQRRASDSRIVGGLRVLRPSAPSGHAVRHGLDAWLRAKFQDSSTVRIGKFVSPAVAGTSNEMLIVSVIHRPAGDSREVRERLVLRIEPARRTLFLNGNLREQFLLQKYIFDSAIVPVPEPLWLETDDAHIGSPFMVMRHVSGLVPSRAYNSAGFLAEATTEQRKALWRDAVTQLARLSAVGPSAVGFLSDPARGKRGCEQQLNLYAETYDWVASESGARNASVERALEWLRANMPLQSADGLSWGDARLGNMMFKNFRCTAVLDWEMASLAGPINDLGWWLMADYMYSEGNNCSLLPGLGSVKDTIVLWEELTGLSASQLPWYDAFAALRAALILQRVTALATGEPSVDNFMTHRLENIIA